MLKFFLPFWQIPTALTHFSLNLKQKLIWLNQTCVSNWENRVLTTHTHIVPHTKANTLKVNENDFEIKIKPQEILKSKITFWQVSQNSKIKKTKK